MAEFRQDEFLRPDPGFTQAFIPQHMGKPNDKRALVTRNIWAQIVQGDGPIDLGDMTGWMVGQTIYRGQKLGDGEAGGWEDRFKDTNWWHYCYFPGVVKGVAMPYAVVYCSFEPDPAFVGHPPHFVPFTVASTGQSLFVDDSMFGDVNVALSVQSSLNLTRPVPGSYIWFTRMFDPVYSQEGEGMLMGASMGLAVGACVVGSPSIAYSGFMKNILVEPGKDGWPDAVMNRRSADTNWVSRPSDVVEDVQELGPKVVWALKSRMYLVIPAKSVFDQPMQKLLSDERFLRSWFLLQYGPLAFGTPQLDEGVSLKTVNTPILVASTLPDAVLLACLAWMVKFHGKTDYTQQSITATPGMIDAIRARDTAQRNRADTNAHRAALRRENYPEYQRYRTANTQRRIEARVARVTEKLDKSNQGDRDRLAKMTKWKKPVRRPAGQLPPPPPAGSKQAKRLAVLARTEMKTLRGGGKVAKKKSKKPTGAGRARLERAIEMRQQRSVAAPQFLAEVPETSRTLYRRVGGGLSQYYGRPPILQGQSVRGQSEVQQLSGPLEYEEQEGFQPPNVEEVMGDNLGAVPPQAWVAVPQEQRLIVDRPARAESVRVPGDRPIRTAPGVTLPRAVVPRDDPEQQRVRDEQSRRRRGRALQIEQRRVGS